MNCQDFQDRLHEYRDETLDADLQAAAQEHLRQCGDCQRVLMREIAVAKAIHDSLERATVGLSLRPETRQNVLKASEPEPAPFDVWQRAWRTFISIPARVIGAGVALLGVLLLVLGLQFHRQWEEDSGSQAVTQSGRDLYVVDVPIQTQTHIFVRQDHTVVDAIAPTVSVGHARFLENSERLSKPL